MNFFRRKKSIDKQLEDVDGARDQVQDSLYNINSRCNTLKNEIKRDFKKGVNPSPAKKINYKRSQIIRDVTQGLYDTLDGIYSELEMVNDFKDIKVDKISNLIENYDKVFKTNNTFLKDIFKMQEKQLGKVKSIIDKQHYQLQNLEDLAADYDLELTDDVTIDLLQEFAGEDTEFEKELPDKFKKALEKRK